MDIASINTEVVDGERFKYRVSAFLPFLTLILQLVPGGSAENVITFILKTGTLFAEIKKP